MTPTVYGIGIGIVLMAGAVVVDKAKYRHDINRAFKEHHERIAIAALRLASQVAIEGRPELPVTWREMVEVETAPCDCVDCAVDRAAERRMVN